MVALATPLDRIAHAFGDAWEPREFGLTSDWIANNFRLSTEYEADPGPYNLDANPFWREVCDAFHDPSVESISLLKSTQIGGTLTAIALMMATSIIDPAPGLIVLPTQDEARFTRDRVYANALVSDPILASKVPPERLRNLLAIDLMTCHFYLAWAGSRQRVRGKPCKWVILSEIDVYEGGGEAGDQTRAAERRTDQFPGSTIVRESTPVGDESPIADYYDASDRRQWWCACPHCKRRQVVRFFVHKSGDYLGRCGIVGYLDDKGQAIEPDVARQNAKYICINGCEIDQSYKGIFIRSGVWLPDGQSFDESGTIQGEPNRSGRQRGYHVWQAFNPKKTWGDLAATYVEHMQAGLLQEFFQNVLGLRFRKAAKLPEWHKLGRRLAGRHQQGHVPAEVWFLTCAADVQGDRVYWVVRGWAPGRNSWLIDWGEFMREEHEMLEDDESRVPEVPTALSSDLFQLDALLDHRYPVDGVNPMGHKTLPIRLMGIDANFRTADVHDYISSLESERLRAIRGDHQVSPRDKYRRTVVEKNSTTGKPYEGGLDLWGIKVDVYKQLLIDRLRGAQDAVGNFWLPEDMPRIGAKYLRQLVNEPPTTTINAKGRKQTVFKPRTTSIGVDFWDCTNYSEALADMVVEGMGWSRPAWEKWLADQRAATQQQTRKPQQERSILER